MVALGVLEEGGKGVAFLLPLGPWVERIKGYWFSRRWLSDATIAIPPATSAWARRCSATAIAALAALMLRRWASAWAAA
jgi:hypothetical protein